MRKNLGLILFFLSTMVLTAQRQQTYTSADLYKKIEKLNFLGSVLYVGAHPDDENTAMISYFSNIKNARTAYLSMNRGDGGQNIIGPEMRELLGVIRTEELLAARNIDGGEQFFTRANDFGFSKNPTETFHFWDQEKVLNDVVLTFRKFRPDVVINRFNHRTEGDTHGHHTASALLSVEAFDAAADKNRFSDQLANYEVWQPKRMYFNDSWFFYGSKEKFHEADHQDYLNLDLGDFIPTKGLSNPEVAALSRSEHKSQGFGSARERGVEMTYIEPIKGDLKGAKENVFAGINTSWDRIKGGKQIGEILYKVQEEFDFRKPEKSLPGLLEAYPLIKKLDDPYWRSLKAEQIEEIIAAAAGLYLEAFTSVQFGTLGEHIDLHFEVVNRSHAQVNLKAIRLLDKNRGEAVKLPYNQPYLKKIEFEIPSDLHYSSPYWLRDVSSMGMYTVTNPNLIGRPNTPAQLVVDFELEMDGQSLIFQREVVYKTVDQIQGEVRQPFSLVPDISLTMKDKVLVFPEKKSRKVEVELHAYADSINGSLHLNHPEDWAVQPEKIDLEFTRKGERKTVAFELIPPENQAEAQIQPEFTTNGKTYTKELILIDYPHIPTKTVLMPAVTKANRIPIKIGAKKIAYIHGAGDEIPSGLREIGYTVDELDSHSLSLEKLEKYDAVVLGIRIYNLNKEVVDNQQLLFDYVKGGGTLVTQYSQSRLILTDKLAPLPMNLTPKRVTDETAEVRFLAEDHPVLNTPNTITKADFENWVQERGLYFPDEWSSDFTPILGMHDRGEEELQGALLIAPYGKGHYVYTGLSFFRQLPAGVPGAYRLFANILAL